MACILDKLVQSIFEWLISCVVVLGVARGEQEVNWARAPGQNPRQDSPPEPHPSLPRLMTPPTLGQRSAGSSTWLQRGRFDYSPTNLVHSPFSNFGLHQTQLKLDQWPTYVTMTIVFNILDASHYLIILKLNTRLLFQSMNPLRLVRLMFDD